MKNTSLLRWLVRVRFFLILNTLPNALGHYYSWISVDHWWQDRAPGKVWDVYKALGCAMFLLSVEDLPQWASSLIQSKAGAWAPRRACFRLARPPVGILAGSLQAAPTVARLRPGRPCPLCAGLQLERLHHGLQGAPAGLGRQGGGAGLGQRLASAVCAFFKKNRVLIKFNSLIIYWRKECKGRRVWNGNQGKRGTSHCAYYRENQCSCPMPVHSD